MLVLYLIHKAIKKDKVVCRKGNNPNQKILRKIWQKLFRNNMTDFGIISILLWNMRDNSITNMGSNTK